MQDNINQAKSNVLASGLNSSSQQSSITAPASSGEEWNRKDNNKKVKIIGIASACILLTGLVVFFAAQTSTNETGQANEEGNTPGQTENIEQEVKPAYSTERDPETGERTLFGSDETKDNSGDAFLKFQEEIMTSSDTTDEEVFDARISIISYHIALHEFDEAEKLLNEINQDELSADELNRFVNMYDYLNEEKKIE